MCIRDRACTDSDSQRVAACSGNELLYLFRTCVSLFAGLYDYLVLYTSQSTKLGLNYYAMSVSVFYNLLCQRDVILERFGRSVDHDRCKSAVDTALAEFKSIAVIQVQSDRNIRVLLYCCLYQFYEVGVVCVSASTLGYLKNNRAV